MSWSYRTDRADEVYGDNVGPVLVAGTQITDGHAGSSAAARTKTYSADGAIDVRTHNAILTKTSAGAYTLAAPTSDGIDLVLSAGTAFAHVVTATGLLQDGVTGGAKSAWTSAAFVGSSLSLTSYNGKWQVVSKNLGGIA